MRRTRVASSSERFRASGTNPMAHPSNRARRAKNPRDESFNECFWEIALMVATDEKTHVIRAIVQESGRNLGARTAPIDKFAAEQHPIRAGISTKHRIGWECRPSGCGANEPGTNGSFTFSESNLVSECLLLAAEQVRFLDLESRIAPILVKCHRTGDSHDISTTVFRGAIFWTRFRQPSRRSGRTLLIRGLHVARVHIPKNGLGANP